MAERVEQRTISERAGGAGNERAPRRPPLCRKTLPATSSPADVLGHPSAFFLRLAAGTKAEWGAFDRSPAGRRATRCLPREKCRQPAPSSPPVCGIPSRSCNKCAKKKLLRAHKPSPIACLVVEEVRDRVEGEQIVVGHNADHVPALRREEEQGARINCCCRLADAAP